MTALPCFAFIAPSILVCWWISALVITTCLSCIFQVFFWLLTVFYCVITRKEELFDVSRNFKFRLDRPMHFLMRFLLCILLFIVNFLLKQVHIVFMHTYNVFRKKAVHLILVITSANVYQFSKFLHSKTPNNIYYARTCDEGLHLIWTTLLHYLVKFEISK